MFASTRLLTQYVPLNSATAARRLAARSLRTQSLSGSAAHPSTLPAVRQPSAVALPIACQPPVLRDVFVQGTKSRVLSAPSCEKANKNWFIAQNTNLPFSAAQLETCRKQAVAMLQELYPAHKDALMALVSKEGAEPSHQQDAITTDFSLQLHVLMGALLNAQLPPERQLQLMVGPKVSYQFADSHTHLLEPQSDVVIDAALPYVKATYTTSEQLSNAEAVVAPRTQLQDLCGRLPKRSAQASGSTKTLGNKLAERFFTRTAYSAMYANSTPLSNALEGLTKCIQDTQAMSQADILNYLKSTQKARTLITPPLNCWLHWRRFDPLFDARHTHEGLEKFAELLHRLHNHKLSC